MERPDKKKDKLLNRYQKSFKKYEKTLDKYVASPTGSNKMYRLKDKADKKLKQSDKVWDKYDAYTSKPDKQTDKDKTNTSRSKRLDERSKQTYSKYLNIQRSHGKETEEELLNPVNRKAERLQDKSMSLADKSMKVGRKEAEREEKREKRKAGPQWTVIEPGGRELEPEEMRGRTWGEMKQNYFGEERKKAKAAAAGGKAFRKGNTK